MKKEEIKIGMKITDNYLSTFQVLEIVSNVDCYDEESTFWKAKEILPKGSIPGRKACTILISDSDHSYDQPGEAACICCGPAKDILWESPSTNIKTFKKS